MSRKPVVFVHARSPAQLGARLTAFALQARSAHAERFELRFLTLDECPELLACEGRSFRWMQQGAPIRFSRHAGQSFVLLRRRVPELMGFQGRALLLDPDILALGDIWELLSRDMQGRALACRPREDGMAGWYSAVTLMDCAQLRHWRWHDEIGELFAQRRFAGPWLAMADEPPERVLPLEAHWNDLDRRTPATRLLHFTDRPAQPWMTGLPYYDDYVAEPRRWARLRGWAWRGPRYRPSRHEAVFVDLLRQAVQQGALSRRELRAQARAGQVRPDILDLLDLPVGAQADGVARPSA